MKKERPILFSTPMIQAIIDGRKTQTRRVIKDHNIYIDDMRHFCTHDKKGEGLCWGKDLMTGAPYTRNFIKHHCRYGNIGDVLWVRESWNASTNVRPEISEPFIYKADRSEIDGGAKWAAKWKPSIHMPKAACRLFLEITSVRVERLQDISEEDAKAEGVELYNNYDGTKGGHGAPMTHKEGFQLLWQSINGEESFTANPWVWVVEFKQIKQTA